MAKSPAWTRKEGKNPEGGLNEKGRASLRAAGHDIKRPQPEGGSRKDSFCARMKGMKAKLTSSETANDPDSRINKSLRKWKCADGGALDIARKYKAEGGVSIDETATQKEKLLERVLRKEKESKTPSSSQSMTTPYNPSTPTPSVSKEQYMRGNLGRGKYALATGGSVGRKGYAIGGDTVDQSNPYLGQVNALYQNILGRQADVPGANYWANQLNTGATTLQNMLGNFAGSQEYQNLYKSDPTKAVSGMYQAALDRAPEQAGLQYWTGQAQHGLTPAQLAAQFSNAPEFQNRNAIYNSYIDYTGKAPSAEQYASAANMLSKGKTLGDITGQVSKSPEAIQNMVNTAYQGLLGHSPDKSALQYWTDQLSSGRASPQDMMNAFASSPEGGNYANTQTFNNMFKELTGRDPSQSEINNPNSLYNDALSKMAAGRMSESQLRQAISQDPEAVNYQNTRLVNDTFQELTGKSPTQAQQDDYASKLASGQLSEDQLYSEINSLPDAKNYQEYVNKGLAPQTAAEKAAVETNKDYFRKALDQMGIKDPNVRNIMAANAQVETQFQNRPEISYANTSNARIKSLFSNARGLTNGQLNELKKDDRAFFNKIYGNKNGNQGGDDGYNYRGRGAVQLTGKANYAKYGELAGLGDALVKNPDLMNDPATAAKVSVAFMKDQLQNNPGKTDFDKITKGVNAHGPTVAKKLVEYKKLPKDGEFTLEYEAPTTPVQPPSPPTPKVQGNIDDYNKAYAQYQKDLSWYWFEQSTQYNAAKSYSYGNLDWNSWSAMAERSAPKPPDPTKYGFSFNKDINNWTYSGPPPTGGNLGQGLVGQGAGGNVAGNTGIGATGGVQPLVIPGITGNADLAKSLSQQSADQQAAYLMKGLELAQRLSKQQEIMGGDAIAQHQTALQNYLTETGSAGLSYLMGFSSTPPTDRMGRTVIPPAGFGVSYGGGGYGGTGSVTTAGGGGGTSVGSGGYSIGYMNKGGAVKSAMDVARAYKKGGPVWDKPRPKSLGKPTPLSSDQKSSAKAMAKAAGRPYPNLVDNMRAAKKS